MLSCQDLILAKILLVSLGAVFEILVYRQRYVKSERVLLYLQKVRFSKRSGFEKDRFSVGFSKKVGFSKQVGISKQVGFSKQVRFSKNVGFSKKVGFSKNSYLTFRIIDFSL